MTKYQTGMDAINALQDSGSGGANSQIEFSPFKSGTTYVVKVLGTSDLISFYSYGIYKQVNSFVAKNPSKKSRNGYPVENLTPWDKAWKYHKDRSKEFNDFHGQEAAKYRPKQRFAFGFWDLTEGKPIIIDLSKSQAQGVYEVIKKYEKRLNRLAFELSKTGTGTSTSVTLTPIIDMDEDLTPEQRKNFENAPDEFDMSLFDGVLYEADEDEQIELLIKAGFDVSLIGYSKPESNEDTDGVDDEEFPF